MGPNTYHNHFPIQHFVRTCTRNSKMDVLHIEWLRYYQRCLFSVLELDARYEWLITSPNTHRSLFPIGHFCVYSVLKDITWKLQVICGGSAYRTTVILSQTFFVCFTVALEIWLGSYGPRQASVVLYLVQHCVRIYCKPVYKYIYIYTSLIDTQLHLTTKLTHHMTA